ncbi:MAG: hypothetical protein LBL75_04085 [Rickettsiales bacterium]|jgi:hypothetical protein|nr:hypothetical protein [Rickettsiales bacterium]
MRKFNKLWLFLGVLPLTAFAADIPPLSQYGQIQNVQSYSSNPFYNMGSYNQKMPVPIYASGPVVESNECLAVVGALVSQNCSARNNCAGIKLMDIQPSIILGLANINGRNYVSACTGYIENAFTSYMQTANLARPENVGFPTPKPATSSIQAGAEFPAVKSEYDARADQLAKLQETNGSMDVGLRAADFPMTAADLTFTERLDIKTQGYEPWRNAIAYRRLTIGEATEPAENKEEKKDPVVPDEKEEEKKDPVCETEPKYADIANKNYLEYERYIKIFDKCTLECDSKTYALGTIKGHGAERKICTPIGWVYYCNVSHGDIQNKTGQNFVKMNLFKDIQFPKFDQKNNYGLARALSQSLMYAINTNSTNVVNNRNIAYDDITCDARITGYDDFIHCRDSSGKMVYSVLFNDLTNNTKNGVELSDWIDIRTAIRNVDKVCKNMGL